MNLHQRIDAFVQLGNFFQHTIEENTDELQQALQTAYVHNGWFTHKNSISQLNAICEQLTLANMETWLKPYKFPENPSKAYSVGIVCAGNIPLVGFHDILCVLISGHKACIKLASDDTILMTYVLNKLTELAPAFTHKITYAERLKEIDAVIATGSNNTARYFEYYFGKYPHIIRKNRNSIAVLSGKETNEELANLAEDIFSYFGLGCRNISKLYVPTGYNFDTFFNAVFPYKEMLNHQKYGNNYDYHRALLLMKLIPFLENGFLMIKEDEPLATPVSVINYEYYNSEKELIEELQSIKDQIQCVALDQNQLLLFSTTNLPLVALGECQKPQLWDYADGVDTMQFLLTLN